MRTRIGIFIGLTALAVAGAAASMDAQTQTPPKPGANNGKTTAPAPTAPAAPVAPSFTIGPDDVLQILVYRDPAMSGDFLVRPDGKITMPFINDIQAGGLTTEELRLKLTDALRPMNNDPVVTVIVKASNSRRVYIMGAVAKTGPVPLSAGMTLLQLITAAGGFTDYAKPDKIQIIRSENGKQTTILVNFNDLVKGKNLQKNNIELKPGDTVMVPPIS
jgi:polysaccharide biosynthesis/export protein